jgi:ABC-2 type transport system permease protein
VTELLPVYRARIQTTLAVLVQYRAWVIISVLGLIVEPIIYMSVWTLIASETGDVAGYSPGDFAAYYITWLLVRHFTVAFLPVTIQRRVRTGEFSPLLMLPVHPIHSDVGEVLALKLIALPVLLIVLLMLALVFPPTFVLHWWSIPAFVLSVVLAFPIRFLFTWVLGMVAFWTTWAGSIYGIFRVAEVFLTGRIAPLVLLPLWIQGLASVLPFRWMLSFPVEVLVGKLTLEAMIMGLVIQVATIVILALLMKRVWRAAVQRYGAVGA